MRKILFFLIVIGALLLGSVGLTTAQEDSEGWVCPEGFEGQTLRVFNWTTYVAPTTIPDFEEACGVTVEYFEFGSNEELVNIIRAESAAYDVIVPTGNYVEILINDGLLQPLDHSKIPNLKNLLDQFREPPYDPGNVYSVPYQWATIGVGYDKTLTGEDILTWEDFFSYPGRVAWLDDQRAMIGISLNLLGYDPNSTDEDEIKEAAQHLLDINQSEVFDIAPDTGQDLLVRGEVDAVIEFNGDIFQIREDCQCDDFVYVIPEEGSVILTDNMAIPFNAPNPDLAHAFIDYILDPQVGADLSNYIAYGTPNAASLPLIDPELLANPGIYPSEETLANSFNLKSAGESEQFYSEAWNRINAELVTSQ